MLASFLAISLKLLHHNSTNLLKIPIHLIPLGLQVHDACGSVTEANVLAAAFELIFEFDEVIAIGYKEKVTLAQVKAFIEMDSHDEKIHEMVQKVR